MYIYIYNLLISAEHLMKLSIFESNVVEQYI